MARASEQSATSSESCSLVILCPPKGEGAEQLIPSEGHGQREEFGYTAGSLRGNGERNACKVEDGTGETLLGVSRRFGDKG